MDRPDGVRRLVVITVGYFGIDLSVWSLGCRLHAPECIRRQTLEIKLPPGRSLMVIPSLPSPADSAATISVMAGSATGGTLGLRLGAVDRVRMRPSFGWRPPGRTDAWYPRRPAGRLTAAGFAQPPEFR